MFVSGWVFIYLWFFLFPFSFFFLPLFFFWCAINVNFHVHFFSFLKAVPSFANFRILFRYTYIHVRVHVTMYACALVHSTVEHFVVADVHVHVCRKITYRNVFSRFAGDLDYLFLAQFMHVHAHVHVHR